jgi:hypothetical protein
MRCRASREAGQLHFLAEFRDRAVKEDSVLHAATGHDDNEAESRHVTNSASLADLSVVRRSVGALLLVLCGLGCL